MGKLHDKTCIVIPYLKTADSGSELKYTLRSLKNLVDWNGEVFIVGDSERWFNNIIHIPCRKRSYSPYEDTENKLIVAINDPRIPEDFILMADDIYITRKTQLKNWYRGDLPREGKGYHQRSKVATRKFLKDKGLPTLDYAVHTPMLMNKQKRLEVHKMIRNSFRGTALLARIVYGNLFIDDAEYYEDKKTKTAHLPKGQIISTQYYTDELKKLFPKESNFEPHYVTPIPKIIHQIWIGTLPPPLKWMNTWKEKNPDWKYMLWGNEELLSYKWKNQHLIDEYIRRYEQDIKGKLDGKDLFVSAKGSVFKGEKATLFAWHVIADLMRYEILHDFGGYMPGSDTLCLKSINDKFTSNFDSYTVRTGNLYEDRYHMILQALGKHEPTIEQKLKLERYHPENASPIIACKKGDKFVSQLVDELHKLKPEELGEAVDTTGNVFMGKMIQKYRPKGLHMVDYVPKKDRIATTEHSIHFAGTTLNAYGKGR